MVASIGVVGWLAANVSALVDGMDDVMMSTVLAGDEPIIQFLHGCKQTMTKRHVIWKYV